MRFNPPPNWPPAPDGWSPKPGWRPPEDWGEPPYGWQLWLPDAPDAAAGDAQATGSATGEAEPPEPGFASAPEEVAEPPKDRVWAKAIEHPFWTTFGALIGIIGLVISVVQIVQSLQTPSASLEVAMVTVEGEHTVRGVVMVGDDETTRPVALTPVELTLQNRGGEPSLITRVEAEVVYFRQLAACTLIEPSEESVAATYQLPIPMKGIEPAENSLSREVRFEVRPGAADRMVLTLGPELQPAFETTPMIMAVKIKLVHDDEETLDVGTVSLVTTVAAATRQLDDMRQSLSPGSRSCVKDNLAQLDEMFAIQARRSDLLDSLRSAYQRASA